MGSLPGYAKHGEGMPPILKHIQRHNEAMNERAYIREECFRIAVNAQFRKLRLMLRLAEIMAAPLNRYINRRHRRLRAVADDLHKKFYCEHPRPSRDGGESKTETARGG